MAGKRVLFIGAVGGMSYAARLAKKYGYEVLTADYYEDSQAKQFSDKKFLVSTMDLDALKKIVDEEKPDGVFTGFSDNNIQSAQQLCSFYGYPCYINERQLQVMQNKLEFKKLCLRHGIPVPHEYVKGESVSYPVIVKPSDAYAAKGITVCQNDEELEAAIEKASALSRNGQVVVEDYLEGKEVMIHFVMLNGKLRITSCLDRVLSSSFKTEKKSLAPLIIYNHDPYVEKALSYEKKMEAMFLELGFENLVGFFQGIRSGNEVYFFEPAVRFGGNVAESFNVKANGVDIVKKFIDYSVSGVMDDSDIDRINPRFDGFYFNLTFFLKEGIVSRLPDEEKLFAMKEVLDVERFCSLDNVIDEKKTNSYGAISYRMLLSLKDKSGLKDLIERIRKVLRVEDEMGNDMIDWDKFAKIDF